METRPNAPVNSRKDFLESHSPRLLFVLNVVLALIYFFALLFLFQKGNLILYWLLMAGEAFHLWQVFTYIYTVWDTEYEPPQDVSVVAPVDIFITVAGEPIEIVEETVRAAATLRYASTFTVYICNDGYVAKKKNWQESETLAERLRAEGLSVFCITRATPGGAKAGNINHALSVTSAPLVAIFDADHVPHADFLEKTVPYFIDPSLGFVQTPQYYKNYKLNYLTRSSWEQQELFYGPICRGKNRLNSVAMCGTNMLISRDALVQVGGMCTISIAEDFVTGLFIHQLGYRSVYVSEVLAEGLATEDLLTYSKQQFRWARGAMDVIFRFNPLFKRGLDWRQKIQYLSSASFYFSGVVVLIDMLLPIVFLYTGIVPVRTSGMLLSLFFLPYIFLTIWCIQSTSNYTFTYAALALSMSSFHIHIRAFFAAMLRLKSNFSISSKRQLSGNFITLATPHILYIITTMGGIAVALLREGISSSFINNTAWALLNIVVFLPFIRAALPEHADASKREVEAPYATSVAT